MSLRIVFAGSPDFAVPVLDALMTSKHQVIAVYTKPDRPAGRGRRLQASPIKNAAEKYQLPIFQPKQMRDQAAQQQLAELQADVMVVVGYGMILPKTILDTPRYGGINIHPSLLPRWRGATPVQSALLAGDTRTGISVFQLDEKMDTGPILKQKTVDIDEHITAGELYQQLFQRGAKLLLEVLDEIESGSISAKPQNDSQATYCRLIKKSDAEINWQQPARQIANQVRAYQPWPIAYTFFQGERLRIWRVEALKNTTHSSPGTIVNINKSGLDIAAGEGTVLRLLEIQRPGGRRLLVSDFINAQKKELKPGITRFG